MNLWINRNWTPMLLNEQRKPFNSNDYIYELKFDGIRAVIFVNEAELVVQSRNGKNITSLFPELQEIKNKIKQNTILDGEIICLNNGTPSFQKIQNRLHLKNKTKIEAQSKKNPAIFMCFDILYHKKDLTKYSLLKRKEILESISDGEVFAKVKYIEKEGVSFFKEVKKRKIEGIVAKKKDSTYEINKRLNFWIKIKNKTLTTFYIGGYIEKKNNTISILLGEKRNNSFFYVGKVVMYKSNTMYLKIKKQNIRKSSTLKNCNEKANFVTPKYTCEVEYIERTKQGILRQPTIHR